MLKRKFKVRSVARDRESDRAAAEALKSGCLAVRRKVDVELTGLRARHEEAADRALSSLESSHDFGSDREHDDESTLVAAEREMIRATIRIKHLTHQLEYLAQIETLVDAWPLTPA